jgi:uncharacterized protein YfaS (alpha-2-macroglobulin family)
MNRQMLRNALHLAGSGLFLGLLLCLPSTVLASEPKSGGDQAKTFTISAIEPDAEEQKVKLQFTAPVQLKQFLATARFFPYAYISHSDSKQIAPDVLLIHAELEYGKHYVISLPEDFASAGKRYKKTLNSFDMPDLPAKVAFLEDKTVIERDSRQMLHLRIANVKRVAIRTLRIPPLLLPFAMEVESNSSDASGMSELQQSLQTSEAKLEALLGKDPAFAPFLSTPSEKSQFFNTEGKKNEVRAFSVPLTFRDEKERGAVELIQARAEDAETEAFDGPRLYRITDIGIAYKRTRDSLLVWTTSLREASPLKDVSLLALTNAQEILYLGKTDANGLFLYKAPDQPPALNGFRAMPGSEYAPASRTLPVSEIACLIAGNGADVSFIEINKEEIDLKNKGITIKDTNWNGLQLLHGTVFTERGAYRPGEEVHFKGMLRKHEEGKIVSPVNTACLFTITDSREEEVYSKTLTLSRFGTAWGTVKLEPYLPLGSYTLQMKYGPELEESASTTFQVQEFQAPRHFTQVTFQAFERANEDYVNWKRNENIVRIKITGSYYAGGPVKHGGVRWKIYHESSERAVPGYEQYSFGYASGSDDNLIETGESILNEKGEIEVDFPLSRDVLSGKNALRVVAAVIDFDGRAASGKGRFEKDLDYILGIASHPDKVLPNQPQSLKVLLMDKNGAPVEEGMVEASVMQQDGYRVPRRTTEGQLDWDYEDVWRKVYSANLPVHKGEGLFEFNIGMGGSYLVSFTYRDREGRTVTSASSLEVEGDGYWSSYEEDEDEIQSLTLASDKEVYRPGETATVRLYPQLPVKSFLVTIEQDGILHHEVLPADAIDTGVAIPITARYAPNIYVSVLGVAPRGDFPIHTGRYDNEAPGFLLGVLSLSVRENSEQLTVRIAENQPELKAEPGRQMQLDIEVLGKDGAGAPAELAVGVVNESVLALTGYKTPDLSEVTHFSGPLGVYTKELRRFLLYQTPFHLAHTEALTGGGGEDEDGLDASDIRKNFNPVAYFHPALQADAQGKVRISFTLPDTMTAYRITVLACDEGGRFGSAQKNLTVTKAFYIEPGLPRFFTEGDAFRFPVAAFNNSGASGTAALALAGDDHVSFSGSEGAGVIPSMDSRKIYVRGEARQSGDAKALFTGALGELKDSVEIALPVIDNHVLGVEALQGSFEKRATVRLPLGEEVLAIPWSQVGYEDVTAALTVSGSPFIHLSGALRYLLKYPYGCIEQTSSGVIALAGLRGLIKAGMVPAIGMEETDRFLSKGIERILSMQTETGGFGYWPGYRNTHTWGSLYAASALTIARLNGFEIPQDRFKRLVDYLKKGIRSKKEDLRFKAFAAYVLSLSGALDSETLKAIDRPHESGDLTTSLTYALAVQESRKASVEALVEKALQSITNRKEDRIFNARYLEPALALLLSATGRSPQDQLADRPAQLLLEGIGKRGFWTSTSDTGWSLYALSQYFKSKRPAGQSSIDISVQPRNGKKETVQLDSLKSHTFVLDPRTMLSNPEVDIESNAPEALYYRLELEFPRLDYAKSGHDGGFRVWKTIENTDGSERLHVGDIVRVTVNMEAERGEKRYIMLDDPLPAGLVAINSALETEEPTPGEESLEKYEGSYWTPNGYYRFQPNFFEVRDQRVLAFRDALWGGVYQFTYYARAVCEGDFNAPPTKVELMYEPEVNGFTPAGKIRIEAN